MGQKAVGALLDLGPACNMVVDSVFVLRFLSTCTLFFRLENEQSRMVGGVWTGSNLNFLLGRYVVLSIDTPRTLILHRELYLGINVTTKQFRSRLQCSRLAFRIDTAMGDTKKTITVPKLR